MNSLVAEKFFNDPRVLEAKKALVDTLQEYQGELTTVRPPQKERVQTYEETIKKYGELRGSPLFYPYLSSGIGNGALVELEDGSVKYDFITGIGVHHFGHSHPQLLEEMLHAALQDTVMQGNLQQGTGGYAFSKLILETARSRGAPLAHCFLSSAGVMAGENALKIAFQKKTPADRVLAFQRNFCGRTLAFAQITDTPAYRQGLPKVLEADYVPFFDYRDPEGSTNKAVEILKKQIQDHPKQHAAMLFELIQGEAGFYPGMIPFFKEIMTVCKENSIAVLVDEVQSFLRTPFPFAFQYFGLDDLVDVVWVGKNSQVCATLFTKEYCPQPGLIMQTCMASTTAIAAGHFILQEMVGGNYFGEDGKIAEMQRYCQERLEKMHKQFPDKVNGPFGVGTMVAFAPYGGELEEVKAFLYRLYEKGVIGFYAGKNPVRVRFHLPIGVVTREDIDAAMDLVEEALI